MKKRILSAILLALIFVLLTGCGSNSGSNNSSLVKAGNLHNTSSNIDISLGMKKDAIDKAMGAPSVIGTFYFYADYGITITYKDDAAVTLATSKSDWETMDHIKTSTSASDVTKLYGGTASGETYTYMFDKTSKLTTNINTAAVTVIFKIGNDKVTNINISKNT
jgi:hypothetical protein